ncbi:uncharacterized protein [Periplaneta americana]|uniref:uncharacterized protein n=1 Tax=Periplaneta americana TaxID=6978 RepID=UPI0037E82B00
MSGLHIILFGLLATVSSNDEIEDSTAESDILTVYSFPTKNPQLELWRNPNRLLMDPLLIFTKTEDDEEEYDGHLAEGGLSELAKDEKAQNIYNALRKQGETAMLLHPREQLKEVSESSFSTRLPVSTLATLAVLAATAVGIPWLLSGSSEKKNETTTSARVTNLQPLYRLELSDHQVRILENLQQHPVP